MNVILQSLQQNVFASTPLCVKSPRFVLQKKNDSVSDASLSWRWQPSIRTRPILTQKSGHALGGKTHMPMNWFMTESPRKERSDRPFIC